MFFSKKIEIKNAEDLILHCFPVRSANASFKSGFVELDFNKYESKLKYSTGKRFGILRKLEFESPNPYHLEEDNYFYSLHKVRGYSIKGVYFILTLRENNKLDQPNLMEINFNDPKFPRVLLSINLNKDVYQKIMNIYASKNKLNLKFYYRNYLEKKDLIKTEINDFEFS